MDHGRASFRDHRFVHDVPVPGDGHAGQKNIVKPVDSYNNDNIGQAAITLITVFVVFQIPCQGPIAWLVVLTLLQGDKCKMFFCTIGGISFRYLEERGWVSVHLKEG